MMIKADLIQAIKTLVDSRGEQWTRLGLSSNGYAWGIDKGIDAILEVLANAESADIQAINLRVDSVVAKINELIDQYNQLLTDHNTPTVPSTAHTVQRL